MRILTLDVETSPHDAWSFNVWQTNLRPEHLKEPTKILTWAAKLLGKKDVYYREHTDADFLERLHALMSYADVIVTYNGDKFDLPHINREFVEAGLPPVRPFASIDMLKVVRKRFKWPHNRLDYVCSRLLGARKLQTGGFDLWPAFMNGDERARKIMRRYNIRDVRLTERLYKRLKQWVAAHPYVGPVVDPDDAHVRYECPACSSEKTTHERPRRTRCYSIRNVLCAKCGTWSEGMRRKIK